MPLFHVLCFDRSLSDLFRSHDLKDVKQKTEQIQNLLTGKYDSLTATVLLSKDRKRA